jgi:hypothetical protein
LCGYFIILFEGTKPPHVSRLEALGETIRDWRNGGDQAALLGLRVHLDGGNAIDLEIVVAAGGVELGL